MSICELSPREPPHRGDGRDVARLLRRRDEIVRARRSPPASTQRRRCRAGSGRTLITPGTRRSASSTAFGASGGGDALDRQTDRLHRRLLACEPAIAGTVAACLDSTPGAEAQQFRRLAGAPRPPLSGSRQGRQRSGRCDRAKTADRGASSASRRARTATCIAAMPFRPCSTARGQATGGRFLLRIEDIDLTRARPEFEAAIFEDLAWLGLAWEEPVLRQRERFEAYRGGARRARTARPALSGLPEPRRDRSACAPRAEAAGARMAARSRRRAALSRRGARLAAVEAPAARWRRGTPYALRLDMRPGARRRRAALLARGRSLRPRDLPLTHRRRSGRLGRRGAGAQGGSGELSPRRRRGRRLAGRHRRRARQGPRSPRPPSTACCRRCSACPSRATSTTGSSSTRPAKNWRSRAARRRCAPAARPAKARSADRRPRPLACAQPSVVCRNASHSVTVSTPPRWR